MQFLELFHRYDYIFKDVNAANWTSPKGNWRLDDSAILKSISLQNKKYLLGTRAGRKTRYAVLDIDSGSKYHNQQELDRLLKTLSDAGIERSSLFRSSFSEGWHLYIFFEEKISSSVVYQQLVKLLKLCNFDVASGTLEVFPHPGYSSVGMGLRLPLQHGFAWLDKKTLDVDYYREELSATKALEFFLDALDSDANSYADFLKLRARIEELELNRTSATVQPVRHRSGNVIPIRKTSAITESSEATILVASVFGHLPLNINAENWQMGRQFHLQGLTEQAQRAKASFCLGHYFFYGDPSRSLPALGYGCEQEREQVIRDFLSMHHNGFSKEISRGRRDAFAQVKRMANWLPFHKRDGEHGQVKTYTAAVPIAWVKENAKRKNNARRRIQDALEALQIRKRPFSTVELQKAAGCARDTLYKHADIWRQEYEALASGFFAACPDEYNSLGDSNVPVPDGSRDPSPNVLTEVVPIGLLAARQVVFELSQKGRKDLSIKESSRLKTALEVEQAWKAKVASLTVDKPSLLSMGDLKTRLYSLVTLLSVAPYEEDARTLMPYVKLLRAELNGRCMGPARSSPSVFPEMNSS